MLVRAAHSANIKERRDCSTALFDARGELVMQAEHIPVHLGSMPDAVAAVLGERAPARRRLDPQRPLPGRHPPARHHARSRPIFADDELLGFAASRAHHADVGGPTPGGHAGRLAPARGRGGGDPAHPRRRRAAGARWPPQMRNPRAAPRRPARAAGRQPDRRASPARAGRQARARDACAPGWRRSSTTPSAARAPRWRSCPTAPTRPRT